MLTMPNYIARLEVAGEKLSPVPSLHKLMDASEASFPKIETPCGSIADRAKLALTAALVEWKVWRLRGLIDTTDMEHFVEAMWAGCIDYRYLKFVDHPEPPDGSIELVLYYAWLAGQAQEKQCLEYMGEAQLISELVAQVRDVLPKAKHKAFLAWAQVVVKRLSEHYTLDDPDDASPQIMGPPVPREACDPDFAFSPAKAPKLLAEFLRSLNPTRNPYLRSVKELKKAGFEGKPYEL